MKTEGFVELTKQLKDLGGAVSGKQLRSAAFTAMLPALRAAQKAAPVGNPPYFDKTDKRQRDPYPRKTYKGKLVSPGFSSRNISRKSILDNAGSRVRVLLGMKPEAFTAVQFIEFGTSKIPKRPWLEPSFRQSIPAVDDRFRAALKRLLAKAAR